MESSKVSSSGRISNFRFNFHALRALAHLEQKSRRMENKVPVMRRWLGSLNSSTLREYRITSESPDAKFIEKVPYLNQVWGAPSQLLYDAATDDQDDTMTALLLFIARIMDPFEQGSTRVERGIRQSLVYSDTQQYSTGLMDTLYYHRDYVDDAYAEGVLDGNIFNAPQHVRDGLAALITVTDSIRKHDLSVLFTRNEAHYDEKPPHANFASYDSEGTTWLSNGELVKYILENPGEAHAIADVMVERRTDDVAIIGNVIDSGVVGSIQSGVL